MYLYPQMKLPEIIILSLAVAFIGIHQVMTVGFGNAYWALMLTLILFFVFKLRRRR
jgi:hypothetical protein